MFYLCLCVYVGLYSSYKILKGDLEDHTNLPKGLVNIFLSYGIHSGCKQAGCMFFGNILEINYKKSCDIKGCYII
jgi:hypothetical protein